MPSTLRYASLFLAIVLALIAQQLAINPASAWWGWMAFAAAAVLAGLSAPSPRNEPASIAPRNHGSRRALRVLSGVGALAAAIGAAWLSSRGERPDLVLLFWLASIVLGSLSLLGTEVAVPLRAPLRWSRGEVLILTAICLVALAARVAWIDDVPRYYFDDESRVGMYLRGIFESSRFPNLFSMGWNSWPVLGMVLQGIFAIFYGVDTTSLRLSSAMAGTVAVVFTYLLARELFSPRVALISAVLFACGRTALDFSRMGICHAQVLMWESLALWSLWRAINRGSGFSFFLTGVGLGLCMHTYNAGQLLPLLWLGWVAIAIVTAPRLTLARWRGGLLTIVGFLFTITPFMLNVTDNFGFAGHWAEYTGMARNRQVISRITEAWTARGPAAGLEILGEQIRLTWLGFGVLPADAYQLGYRGGGMLDHVSAPLFILGLGICLARFWTPRYAFMLYWWLLTTITGGVITQAPPAFVRMVGILPVLALFGAMPLEALLRSATSAALRITAMATTALLGVAMAFDNYRTYFVIFPSVTSQPSSELTRYLATTPPGSLALLLGAEHFLELSTEIYRLNLVGRGFANFGDLSQALPLREIPDHPITLIFGETQLSLVPYAQSLYPGAPVTEVTERGGSNVLFKAMQLSTEQIAARQGLSVVRDGAPAPANAVPGEAGVTIADPFNDAVPLPRCSTLKWTGGVYWPSDEAVSVKIESPPSTSVTLGTTTLPRATAPSNRAVASIRMPRGWNQIIIEEQCGGERHLAVRIEVDKRVTALQRTDLRPDFTGEGLLTTYLRNETPLLHTIESHINAFAIEEILHHPYDVPVRMPFTATWSGSLEAETAGDYQFEAVFSGPVLVTLDGTPLFQETVKIPEDPRTARAMRHLEPGPHALFALWDSTRRAHTSRRIFQLFWQPPGGQRELIPPPRLRPAQAGSGGALPTIEIPPTPTPIALHSGPRKILSELVPQDVKYGFAPPRMDKMWSGAPITMRGIEYTHGIGVHAWARLTYAVPPETIALEAIVGLSDSVAECPRATVRFEVRDDHDALLYDSGIMDTFAPPKLAKVGLKGVSAITLVVSDAGDGIDCDHANWAEASFLLP